MQTQQQNQYPRPNLKTLQPIHSLPTRNATTMIAQNVFFHPSAQSQDPSQNQPPKDQQRKTFESKKDNNNNNGMTKFGSIKKNKTNTEKQTTPTNQLSKNHYPTSLKLPQQFDEGNSFRIGATSNTGTSAVVKQNPYNHQLLRRPLELVGKRSQAQKQFRETLDSKSRFKEQESKKRKEEVVQMELKNYYNNNSEEEQEFMGGEEIQMYRENKNNSASQNMKLERPNLKIGIDEEDVQGVNDDREREERQLYQKFGLAPHRNKKEVAQRQNIDNYLRNQNAQSSNNTDFISNNNNSNQSNNRNRVRTHSQQSPRISHPSSNVNNLNEFVDSRQSFPTSHASKYGPGGIQTLEFNPEKEKLIILDSKETENVNFYSNKLAQFCENIVIPPLSALPTADSAPEELVQIAKHIFTSFNCKINEHTVINVRKYRNCVFLSIDPQNNVLYHYETGKLYYGGWKIAPNGEGEKEGHGIEILPGRYKFKGYFIYGKKHGVGTLINFDGSAYVGQWKNGMKHGSGRQLDVDGIVYEGEWKEGMKSGYGKLINSGRLEFEGVFSKGLKNGYGKQYFENGDQYDGNYLNHKFEGKGTYIWQSGAIYTGEFKSGKRNGYGQWKSSESNYDSYNGQYVDDMKHGQGIYKWHNGATYEGQFRQDLKHGQGTITYENGKVAHLIWNNGKAQKKISANLSTNPPQNRFSERKPINRDGSSHSQPQFHVLQSQMHIQSQTKQRQNNVVFRSRVSSRSTQNLHSAASNSSSGIKNYPKGVTFHTSSTKKLNTNNEVKKAVKKSQVEMIRLKFDNNQFQKAIGKNWNKNLDKPSLSNSKAKEISRPQLPKDRPYQGIQNSAGIQFDL